MESSNTIGGAATSADASKPESLLCRLCSKSFLQKASRNRHQLYCRQRQGTGHVSRRKSCIRCRKAKTGCDSAVPQCTRCVMKLLQCIYEPREVSQSVRSQDVETTSSTAPLLDKEFQLVGVHSSTFASPDFPFDETMGHAQEALYDESFYGPTRSTPYHVSSELLASYHDVCYDFMGSTPGIACQKDVLMPVDASPLFSDSSMPGTGSVESVDAFLTPTDSSPYTLEKDLGTSDNWSVNRIRSPFIPAGRSFGSQLGHSFMLQNLCSYPAMMLDEIRCPPFISSCFLRIESGSLDCAKEAEPLAICKSILQMHLTKTPQTSAFVWRTLAAENKRLYDEYIFYDDWNTVAALQALAIYILLIISDTDVQTVEFDEKLVQTMTSLAIKTEAEGFLHPTEQANELPPWSDWTLMESKRRTVTTLFIIHLLYDINPGQRAKAMNGLISLPLPCTKALWTAPTAAEWTTEYTRQLNQRGGRSLLTYGDLVSLQDDSTQNPKSLDLNHWFLNMDALGTLVMMAATSLRL